MATLEPITRIEQFLNDIIEQGGGGGGSGGGVVFTAQDANGVLDKTWREIRTAMNTTIVVVTSNDFEGATEPIMHTMITSAAGISGEFKLWDSFNTEYTATSADGYPVNGSQPVPVGN